MTTTFTYDGDGHRVAKVENGQTTTYTVAVLGLSQVLVETSGSVTTCGQATQYVYGHDLLAEKDGSAWTWHLGDGLGSVRQLADGNGQVTLAQGYTPFGVPLWHTGSGVTGYGFTREWWGAYSALLFLRARYYELRMGRFINKDPWTGSVWLPQTLHRYSYVLNNPPTYVDPSGHQQQFPMIDEVYSPGYQGPISEGPKLPETRYWVSEDYGFFDKSHINTGRPAERLQAIEALVGTCKTGEITFRARVKAGPVDGEFVGTYKVFGDKIELGQVNGVFLAMYEDWSIRFETWEGSLGVWFIRPGAGTSFAVEDLPTHYVAAVMAIQDISKEDVFFGYLGGITGSDEEPSRDIKNMEFTPLVPIGSHKWLRQSWPPQMVVTPIVDPGLWCPVSFVGYVQGVPVYDEDTWGKIEE